jgi:N-acetylneuraminic acid mutarotase
VNKRILSSLIIIIVIFLGHLFLFTALKSTENPWATLEPMPIAKAGIEVAVVNGKLYVIDSGINYEYNPANDTWTTKTPMPTPRTGFGIAVVENKIYAIGGSTGDYTYSNVNEVYDPSTDTWETKTSMPTTRHAMDANVVDGKIYVIGGGQRPPHDDLDVNEVYDPKTDTWTTKTPIPTEVWDYASAVVDEKIYILGGAVGLSLNQIYDTETDTWSTGASLPRGVDSAAAGATTGVTAPKRIYVIGGKQNLDAVNFNQVYNPEKDRWSIGTAMPTARYGHGVAVVNDTLYAIGGIEGWIGAPVSAANEQYTPFG